MSVGRSKITPYKQNCFRTILEENIYKCNCVFKKYEGEWWLPKTPKYHIYDFTAGDMETPKTPDTSPYIILQTLLDNPERVNFKAKFYEKSIKTTYKNLQENIHNFIESIEDKDEREYFLNNVKTHPINFQNDKDLFHTRSKGNKLGLAYFDSNGCGDFNDWEALSEFSKNHGMVDMLFNISILHLKRCFWNSDTKHHLSLSELLSTIDKKHWWIRTIPEKNNPWEFVMILATNMSTYSLSREGEDFFEANLTDIFDIDRYPGNILIDKCDKFITTNKNNKK